MSNCDIDNLILVFWRDLKGNDFSKYVPRNIKISLLKELFNKDSETRLIFAGKQLYNEKTLTDYHISHMSTVHEVLRLSCGCKIFPNGSKECQLIVKLKDMGFEQPSIPQLLNTYNGDLNKVTNAILDSI